MTKLTIQDLLFNDQPITINRKLAKCLGLKEAVVFQQIHYWLEINKKTNNNYKEGKYWTYNSVKEWHKNEFDFMSIRTVERTLQSLEKSGLLESNCFNKMAGDKTKWYTINYDKLLEVCEQKLLDKEALSIKRSESGKKGAAAKISNSISENTIQPTWQNGTPSCQVGRTIQPTWQNGTAKLAEPIPEITTEITTETTTCSSSNAYEEFENNICELKKTTLKKFSKILSENDKEMVLAVIDECSNTNVRSYKGFEVAFNSYLERGCKTKYDVIDAATKYRNEKKNNKNKNYNSNNKNNKFGFNDFSQRNYSDEELIKLGDKLSGLA